MSKPTRSPRRRRTERINCEKRTAGPFNTRNEFIADYLRFNAELDTLLGVTPSIDREPYSLYNPVRVEPLLETIRRESDGAPA